ncbi:YpbS family protein [Paenibacillus turpanensis]|uniref:YpbS family protein n=1 Tax=Paenibacillus turpanensis TaxID=2689078 RepID=UPI00140996A2|nr:YpbS family protein [Paenibacillus turpanensis]
MSVHEAISEHSRKQHEHLQRFLELDALREQAIQLAVADCLAGKPFTVEAINETTRRINDHAHHGISPTRVYVTEQMVRDYAEQLNKG